MWAVLLPAHANFSGLAFNWVLKSSSFSSVSTSFSGFLFIQGQSHRTQSCFSILNHYCTVRILPQHFLQYLLHEEHYKSIIYGNLSSTLCFIFEHCINILLITDPIHVLLISAVTCYLCDPLVWNGVEILQTLYYYLVFGLDFGLIPSLILPFEHLLDVMASDIFFVCCHACHIFF
jgi:hypothetical protein